ncbi:MAG: hypothetical protein QM662_17765 [Gordonia sp. (in: high G+C Gram-positive bacteria)]
MSEPDQVGDPLRLRQSITFTVQCRQNPDPQAPDRPRPSIPPRVGDPDTRPGYFRHPVTIETDWTVVTPHADLEQQAVLAALSGERPHACVDLPRMVGQAQQVIATQTRHETYPIRYAGAGRWLVDGSPSHVFGSAVTAASFIRTRAWDQINENNDLQNRRHLDKLPTESLAGSIVDAAGRNSHPPRLWARIAASLLAEHNGVDILWDAGIHPRRCVEIWCGRGKPRDVSSAFAYIRWIYSDISGRPPVDDFPLVRTAAATAPTRRPTLREWAGGVLGPGLVASLISDPDLPAHLNLDDLPDNNSWWVAPETTLATNFAAIVLHHPTAKKAEYLSQISSIWYRRFPETWGLARHSCTRSINLDTERLDRLDRKFFVHLTAKVRRILGALFAELAAPHDPNQWSDLCTTEIGFDTLTLQWGTAWARLTATSDSKGALAATSGVRGHILLVALDLAVCDQLNRTTPTLDTVFDFPQMRRWVPYAARL